MKKNLLIISVLFLVFMAVWTLFGKSSSEFLRDVKIIVLGLILVVYIISLVVIGIGEKNVVKHPFAVALGISFVVGFINGSLIFKNTILIFLTMLVFAGLVVFLQYKFETFTNKKYKNNSNLEAGLENSLENSDEKLAD
ncbi:MAG: hypothetical protein GX282_05020 [Campylobacteraceae bacterium]|nr:hypothetical protein [Campylobacteraceae bacterium]